LVLPADGLTSSTEEWKRKLIVPDAPIDPLQHTHNDGTNHTHAGGNVTHEHSSDTPNPNLNPTIPEPLQQPPI